MGSTQFFFERVGGSGRIFFVWVVGSEKNSNSCLVASLFNQELINKGWKIIQPPINLLLLEN